MSAHSLHRLVLDAAATTPAGAAVLANGEAWTYAELDCNSERVASELRARGVGRGARVGVWLDKSPWALAAMQGVLRAGAAYVPIDPMSPPARARLIIDDCDMACVITTETRAATASIPLASRIDVALLPSVRPDGLAPETTGGDDLAYILYTSGSTGTPKGVCISHTNALAFIEWAHTTLEATPKDRFANHAPFHFDISVLDIYVAFAAAATVALIPESAAYIPSKLVEFVDEVRPTIWYSVPSALRLMMRSGAFAEPDSVPMRAICFAGEVFPLADLQELQRRCPGARLLNLYGPTETNVCTYFEVSEDLETRTSPLPIGRACSGDRAWVRRADGREGSAGDEGELWVSGPTVMRGYWNRTAQEGPYATGDIVRVLDDGGFAYLGRRDDMSKVRGYRVELGEIEAAIASYETVRDVAVCVVGDGIDARIVAALSCDGTPPSLLKLKAHCAQRVPRYMLPDRVVLRDALPRNRNGKVDRKRLQKELTSPCPPQSAQ